jgi:hypothetical protein
VDDKRRRRNLAKPLTLFLHTRIGYRNFPPQFLT